ncbi:hypothetical protein, partial [Luteitalea sp.]|uniref:hypothetical protein n=1 Tax=Luteitalea sp. TaxID=2004800 RepID=UPI0025BB8794
VKAVTLLALSAALLAGAVATAIAQRTGAFDQSINHPAIRYNTTDANTVVEALNRKLADKSAALVFDEQSGYLKSVLNLLRIPVESQVLVYTQTSLQAQHITMANPRALYFNDHASVGFIRGSGLIEIVAQDPVLGSVFYVVHQERAATPSFGRESQCLRCHLSWDTLGVPGQTILSTFPRKDANDYANGFTVDHFRPIADRWGGWYVTGKRVPAKHAGNLPLFAPKRVETPPAARVSLDGQLDWRGYPTPFSDIVALMVMEHQAHLFNLLTRATWESRVGGPASEARVAEAVDAIVDYLLFVDEAPITDGPIQGSSGFAEKFMAEGPRDGKGRSLRDLDLQTRLQTYPLSYMIYSPPFQALPAAVKSLVMGKIDRVLAGEETAAKYSHLTPPLRQAIAEILAATM